MESTTSYLQAGIGPNLIRYLQAGIGPPLMLSPKVRIGPPLLLEATGWARSAYVAVYTGWAPLAFENLSIKAGKGTDLILCLYRMGSALFGYFLLQFWILPSLLHVTMGWDRQDFHVVTTGPARSTKNIVSTGLDRLM